MRKLIILILILLFGIFLSSASFAGNVKTSSIDFDDNTFFLKESSYSVYNARNYNYFYLKDEDEDSNTQIIRINFLRSKEKPKNYVQSILRYADTNEGFELLYLFDVPEKESVMTSYLQNLYDLKNDKIYKQCTVFKIERRKNLIYIMEYTFELGEVTENNLDVKIKYLGDKYLENVYNYEIPSPIKINISINSENKNLNKKMLLEKKHSPSN